MEAHASRRFAALDACRGFCAVAVMLFHLDAATHFYAWPVVRNGYVAVDFFFVLSGFVIASAYGRRLSTPHDLRRFALRRFGRLYPLHAAVLVAYVLIQCGMLWAGQDAFTGNYSLASLIANVPLLQGFGSLHETWNYPAWSISVELWTNLVFGLYVFSLGRRSAVLSALLLVASGAYALFADRLPWSLSPDTADALGDVAQSVFGFLLGAFLFTLYTWAGRFPWRPKAFAEGLALALVAVAFAFRDLMPGLVVPLLFGVVVLVLAYETGPVSAFLRRPLCVGLGTISYSVYLTHSLYLTALESAVSALGQYLGQPATVPNGDDAILVLGGPWVMDAAALLTVLATLAGSILTYRFVEAPARQFFNRLSDGCVARAEPTRATEAARRSAAVETTTR